MTIFLFGRGRQGSVSIKASQGLGADSGLKPSWSTYCTLCLRERLLYGRDSAYQNIAHYRPYFQHLQKLPGPVLLSHILLHLECVLIFIFGPLNGSPAEPSGLKSRPLGLPAGARIARSRSGARCCCSWSLLPSCSLFTTPCRPRMATLSGAEP